MENEDIETRLAVQDDKISPYFVDLDYNNDIENILAEISKGLTIILNGSKYKAIRNRKIGELDVDIFEIPSGKRVGHI